MNNLQELVQKKLLMWPEGVESISVNRRDEWMLNIEKGGTTFSSETAELFRRLGPCSHIYRYNTCTKEQFFDMRKNG